MIEEKMITRAVRYENA